MWQCINVGCLAGSAPNAVQSGVFGEQRSVPQGQSVTCMSSC